MRDLSKERQSRLEAERRLKEALLESETCKSRLESLQEDFSKMQDTMNAVMEYQNNLEQLKQEKNCLVQKYEVMRVEGWVDGMGWVGWGEATGWVNVNLCGYGKFE